MYNIVNQLFIKFHSESLGFGCMIGPHLNSVKKRKSMNFEVIDDINQEDHSKLEFEFSSHNLFLLFSVLSIGLYPVWWVYKGWRYYQIKENLDIMPAARAIFAIIWIIPLFEKINEDALQKGYGSKIPSILLFIGILLCNVSDRFAPELAPMGFLAILFYIPPVKALNFAIDHDDSTKRKEESGLSPRQIVLVILSILIWSGLILLILQAGNLE